VLGPQRGHVRGGGAFKRWGLMGGPQVTGESAFGKDSGSSSETSKLL
jgi:hypothetical protein